MNCEGTGFCDSLSGLVSPPRRHVTVYEGCRIFVPEVCSSGEDWNTFYPSMKVLLMPIPNWDPEMSHTKF